MNKRTIPKSQRAGQMKKLAAIQVLAEELSVYYQKQDRLSATEVAQMTGIMRNLGMYAQRLLDAGVVIQDMAKP